MPEPVYFAGQRLPASYANFYIANGLVLAPTFGDPQRSRGAEHAGALVPGSRSDRHSLPRSGAGLGNAALHDAAAAGQLTLVAHASACWCELELALPGPWAEAHSSTLKRAPPATGRTGRRSSPASTLAAHRVGHRRHKLRDHFVESRRRSLVHWLIHVVRRRVVAHAQPLLRIFSSADPVTYPNLKASAGTPRFTKLY